MQFPGRSSTGPEVADVIAYLIGVVGVAASLTIIFLSMRSVMDIGGYCAEGGPYVIQTHCPEGVGLMLPLSIFALLGFGGLVAWRGARLGGPFPGLVVLAWPGLFLSLGWNFLEYGSHPPGDDSGLVWSWIFCGVVFVVMGGVPLLGFLFPGAGSSALTSGSLSRIPAAGHVDRLRTLRSTFVSALVARQAGDRSTPDTEGSPRETGTGTTDEDLVSRLERLAELRRSGSLTADEFEAAKRQLIVGDRR
jgi:hypothetical protein